MASRLIAVLLRCLPASFRDEFGVKMRAVVPAEAEADLDAIAAAIARAHPGTSAGFRIYVRPLQSDIVGDTPRLLAIVAGSLALVLPGALALTRLMKTLLFEVQPGDPATLTAGIFVLLLVAVIACAWPARRALRLNPATALRAE